MNEEAAKRDWFYWFMAIFTLSQIPVSIFFMVDFFLHPFEADVVQGTAVFRMISALGIVPIVIGTAILVIRKAPHNVTGLFLIQWVTIIIAGTRREDPFVEQWYSTAVGWVAIWFLPLFFPDGRVFPRRFESLIRGLCVGLIFALFGWTLAAPNFVFSTNVANPLFVPALEVFAPLFSVLEPCILLAIIVFILPSLVSRYRHGNPLVRQQMKWLGRVFVLLILLLIPMGIFGLTTAEPQKLGFWGRLLFSSFSLIITLAPFIAVAYAILRHRLYDIDIIIRRTLIYSILSAILLGVYFGTVILVQQVFQSATGEVPDFAIVLSTLLIAALFNPLRQYIQAQIDRRFYRRKYDVEQTLAEFQQNLREEVDMPTLQSNLVAVVNETMQPSSIRLWLKESK